MYISKYTKSSDSRREPFNNGFIERYIINDTYDTEEEFETRNSILKEEGFDIACRTDDDKIYITYVKTNTFYNQSIIDRYQEIMRAMSDYMLVGEKISNVIQELLRNGITKDELTEIFLFDKEDVNECINSMTEEECEKGFYMTAKDILDTIEGLSHSQGFYSRLYEYIMRLRDNNPEDYTNYMKDLESHNFKNSVDLIMYLET